MKQKKSNSAVVNLSPHYKWKIASNRLQITMGRQRIFDLNLEACDVETTRELMKLLSSSGLSFKTLKNNAQHPFLKKLVELNCLAFSGSKFETLTMEALNNNSRGKYSSSALLLSENKHNFEIRAPYSPFTFQLPKSKLGQRSSLSSLFQPQFRAAIRKVAMVPRAEINETPLEYFSLQEMAKGRPKKTPRGNFKVTEIKKSKVIFLRPGKMDSLDEIFSTHSQRPFDKKPSSLKKITRLLELCGRRYRIRNSNHSKRKHPSGGGIYEADIYLAAHNVKGLESGFYFYDGLKHSLQLVSKQHETLELLSTVVKADTGNQSVPNCTLWISVNYALLRREYGSLALRLCYMNTGVLLDRFYIAAKRVGIGGCAVGDFNFSHLFQQRRFLPQDVFMIAGYAF